MVCWTILAGFFGSVNKHKVKVNMCVYICVHENNDTNRFAWVYTLTKHDFDITQTKDKDKTVVQFGWGIVICVFKQAMQSNVTHSVRNRLQPRDYLNTYFIVCKDNLNQLKYFPLILCVDSEKPLHCFIFVAQDSFHKCFYYVLHDLYLFMFRLKTYNRILKHVFREI